MTTFATYYYLVRAGRCFDGETGNGEVETNVFPCIRDNWGQLVSVGTGQFAPTDAIYISVPQQRQRYMEEQAGQTYHPTLCLGMARNGSSTTTTNSTVTEGTGNHDHDDRPNNNSNKIVMVPCFGNRTDMMILEFFFVPFIIPTEEEEERLQALTHDPASLEMQQQQQQEAKEEKEPVALIDNDGSFLETSPDPTHCVAVDPD